VQKKKISPTGSPLKAVKNLSASNIKIIKTITRTVTSYDYDKFGRVIGTRKEVWNSNRPALTASTYVTSKAYESLGRKAQTESTVENYGIDVNADAITNIQYDANGNVVSYQYSRDGKVYYISNITYYGAGPYQGYIASYSHSDGTNTTQYSNIIYDETGAIISFTKTLPDGTKEYHSISRNMSGQITSYIIRDENRQIIASFNF